MTTTRAWRRHVSRVFGPHRRWATGIAILGVGLAGSALLLATGPQATPVEHEEKAWPVSTQVVEHRTLAPRFVTWARFEASQVARLRAAVDAPVQSVHVRAGDRVAAGDVLVRLEATDFELAVVQAAADVAAAEADLASFEVGGRRLAAEAAHQLRLSDIAAARLARHERLLADGTVSSSVVDEVRREASQRAIELARHQAELADLPHRRQRLQASIQHARARERAARANLDRSVVRAPFDGPVLAVDTAPGDHSRGATLVTIAAAESLELRATVPERVRSQLTAALAQGKSVYARPMDAAGDTPVRYALRRTSADIKAGRSGIDAWFAVPLADTDSAQIGRIARLEVVLPAQPDLVAVPLQALYDNRRVYLVVDGRLRAVDVQRLGETRDAANVMAVLVRSPLLLDGDVLMTSQLPAAISGLRVAPLTASPAGPAGRS